MLKISNRKGQIAKWLACFAGLALAVVSLVALNSASAAESPFEIVDAKITASSEGVISEISDFDETKITTSATFHKKDENIKYLVTIKNTSDKDYTIKNISDDNKNAYIAEYRKPHVGKSCNTEYHYSQLESKGKYNVVRNTFPQWSDGNRQP